MMPLSFETRTRRVFPCIGLIALVGVNACATIKPVDYKDLSSTNELKPTKDGDNAFQYVSPDIQSVQYANLIVDPVTVYTGDDSQFSSVSPDNRVKIAQYMQQQFTAALAKDVNIVETAAAPNTVRLHLTLTGMRTSTPVISTLSHVAPGGIVINAGLGAAGRGGTFTGSISYAAEVYDATTDELKYAVISQRAPFAMDVTSSFGRLDAAKTGVRHGAQELNQDLIKAGLLKASTSS